MTNEEWIPVAKSDPGGGYEWDSFSVMYSQGEYFWSQQSGCSCDWLDETDRSRYQKGEKADVYNAIFRWNGGSFGNITDATRLMEQVFHWKPPEPLNKPMTEEEIANDQE